MSSYSSIEKASRALDLTARTIDLLSVVGRLSDVTGTAALIAKELGRWLGREGLDEHELGFLLSKSQALVMPNDQERVKSFFTAVTSNRSQPAVVPLWAMPSGALGKYLTSDPQQRWISSTLCCLFRYHDQEFTKAFLSCFLTINSMEGSAVPQKSQLNASPVKLKLDMVVKKVVESTYLHVANAGLVGSDEECPKLPRAFDWACKDGHNIEAYHMAMLIKNISEAKHEVVIQSKYLLTNVVLWMLWHYSGRLRVVVSGKVVFDRVLWSDERTVECRVAKFCAGDRSACGGFGNELTLFYVMENIWKSLHLLFRGEYDSADDKDRTGLCVRQKLYEWPHRYPKGHTSTQSRARATAKELVKWFLRLPVESASIDLFPTTMAFDVNLRSINKSPSRGLTIGDLLGQSPQLLNMPFELDRAFVLFSKEHCPDSDGLPDLLHGYDNEDLIRAVLGFFPILQDLVQDLKRSCECHECQAVSEAGNEHQPSNSSTFNYDTNCLGYLALSETMFYFAHAVADAFGSPDASGIPSLRASLEGDLGALEILADIVWSERGRVEWGKMSNTAVNVFLGAR